MIKDRIVLGVKDINLKDRLLRITNLDLSKAIETCRESQQAKLQLERICENKVQSETIEIDAIKNRKFKKTRIGNTPSSTKSPSEPAQSTPGRWQPRSRNNQRASCTRCGLNTRILNVQLVANSVKSVAKCCFTKGSLYEVSEQSLDRHNLFLGSIESTDICSLDTNTEWFEILQLNNCINVKFKLDPGAHVNILPLKESE